MTLALYVSDTGDTGGAAFTPGDYAAFFAAAFEDPIGPNYHRRVRHAHGPRPTSHRVLFTPAVNRLTERQATDGFIGGFFYGLDLLPDRANRTTERSSARSASTRRAASRCPAPAIWLTTVPVVLAHELVHMVNFRRARGRTRGSRQRDRVACRGARRDGE